MIKTQVQRMDLMSIWEAGLRWSNCEPDETDPLNLPSNAQNNIRELLNASEHTLNLYNVDGDQELDIYIPIIGIEIANKVQRLARTLARKREYPKSELDDIYISKEEVEKWSLIFDKPLPIFWYSEDEIEYHDKKRAEYHEYALKVALAEKTVKKKKLTPVQEDRLLCQKIATRLWEKMPDMTIAAMILRDEIQIEGNGKHYTPKTLRKWLSKVAPLHVKKPGRRPNK